MASPCPTFGHARPSIIETKEGCDNLDKRVSRDFVSDIWANAHESDDEASMAVPKPDVDA